MFELNPIMAQLVRRDPMCHEVAVDLANDGTLHLANEYDMASVAIMRGETPMYPESCIGMGAWDNEEKFVNWMFDRGYWS